MQVQKYESLFRLYKAQPVASVFAHFHPEKDPLTGALDFDAPFRRIASKTIEGGDAWEFANDRFAKRYQSGPPKLRNYLNYTFVRLRELESTGPGGFFLTSSDSRMCCFNTGLQDAHAADLYAIFAAYQAVPGPNRKPACDWVYRGTVTAREPAYRDHFGINTPELAWYSSDSRDFIFNTEYSMDSDVFDHMFERAKERSGFPESASDESVRNYLKGVLGNLIPKIKRNYKTAIPMYFVQDKRMQLLLPFVSITGEVSCLLVERDDANKCYKIKTILDMDQAYFSARLITRPDKEWLNP